MLEKDNISRFLKGF